MDSDQTRQDQRQPLPPVPAVVSYPAASQARLLVVWDDFAQAEEPDYVGMLDADVIDKT